MPPETANAHILTLRNKISTHCTQLPSSQKLYQGRKENSAIDSPDLTGNTTSQAIAMDFVPAGVVAGVWGFAAAVGDSAFCSTERECPTCPACKKAVTCPSLESSTCATCPSPKAVTCQPLTSTTCPTCPSSTAVICPTCPKFPPSGNSNVSSTGTISQPCPQCLPWPNGTAKDGSHWQAVKIPVMFGNRTQSLGPCTPIPMDCAGIDWMKLWPLWATFLTVLLILSAICRWRRERPPPMVDAGVGPGPGPGDPDEDLKKENERLNRLLQQCKIDREAQAAVLEQLRNRIKELETRIQELESVDENIPFDDRLEDCEKSRRTLQEDLAASHAVADETSRMFGDSLNVIEGLKKRIDDLTKTKPDDTMESLQKQLTAAQDAQKALQGVIDKSHDIADASKKEIKTLQKQLADVRKSLDDCETGRAEPDKQETAPESGPPEDPCADVRNELKAAKQEIKQLQTTLDNGGKDQSKDGKEESKDERSGKQKEVAEEDCAAERDRLRIILEDIARLRGERAELRLRAPPSADSLGNNLRTLTRGERSLGPRTGSNTRLPQSLSFGSPFSQSQAAGWTSRTEEMYGSLMKDVVAGVPTPSHKTDSESSSKANCAMVRRQLDQAHELLEALQEENRTLNLQVREAERRTEPAANQGGNPSAAAATGSAGGNRPELPLRPRNSDASENALPTTPASVPASALPGGQSGGSDQSLQPPTAGLEITRSSGGSPRPAPRLTMQDIIDEERPELDNALGLNRAESPVRDNERGRPWQGRPDMGSRGGGRGAGRGGGNGSSQRGRRGGSG